MEFEKMCQICFQDEIEYKTLFEPNQGSQNIEKKCEHLACIQCLSIYLKCLKSDINQVRRFQIDQDDDQSNFSWRLPCFGSDDDGKKCPCEIDQQILQHYGKDNEEFQEFNRENRQTLQEIQDMLFSLLLFVCPTPECNNKYSVPKTMRVVRCTQCQIKYCKSCLQKEHPGECDEMDKIKNVIQSQPPIDDFNGLFNKIIEQRLNDIERSNVEDCLEQFQKYRYCPKEGCQQFSTKDKGCNHVQCHSCQLEYCFICMAPRSPILAHGNHYHRIECPDSRNDKNTNQKLRNQKHEHKPSCKKSDCDKTDEEKCIKVGHICLECQKNPDSQQVCQPPKDFQELYQEQIKNLKMDGDEFNNLFSQLEIEAFKFKLSLENRVQDEGLKDYFYQRNWKLMQEYVEQQENVNVKNQITEDYFQELLQKFKLL